MEIRIYFLGEVVKGKTVLLPPLARPLGDGSSSGGSGGRGGWSMFQKKKKKKKNKKKSEKAHAPGVYFPFDIVILSQDKVWDPRVILS